MDPGEKTSFSFPTQIRFGKDVIRELGDHVKAQGLKAPLLVTDPLLRELPFFAEILTDLANKHLASCVFSDIQKNPVKSDVLKGARAFEKSNSDCIVAIGPRAALGGR